MTWIKMNGAAFQTAYVQSFATAKDFIKAVDPVIFSDKPATRDQILTDIYKIAKAQLKKK